MKTRFRMIIIAHSGFGIGFHKRFMWRIIIPPTMDYSFRNQCRGFKKTGSIWAPSHFPHIFPSYLFFHTSDSGQIWYLLKAVIKDYPTLLRARRMKTNSWRTLEVIGTNLLA